MYTIVVGVDGAEASPSARRFAITESRILRGEVRAVRAWHGPAVVCKVGLAGAHVAVGDIPISAREALQMSFEKAGDIGCGVPLAPVACKGQAADVLCKQASDANLLVVGSLGLGGFTVSRQCAAHAHCPVAIVPGGAATAGAAQ